MRPYLPPLLALSLAWASTAWQEPTADADPLRPLVAESLTLLQSSAGVWSEKRTCISCHHQGLGLLTIAVAREAGLPVDETLIQAQIRLMRADLRGGRADALQGYSNINGQIGQPYRLWAFAANGVAQDAETDALAYFLAGLQHPDGHWLSESHRPPLEDSEFTATALALRALQVYSPPSRAADLARRLARARSWLAAATPRSTEERVMQLLGLAWSGSAPAELAPLRDALLAEQLPDGGWAQVPERASDAYATGQALVVLNQAAGLPVTDAAYERGLNFLLSARLDDGTWLVNTRRSGEGLPYFETGFPHGVDQFISYPGTCWATLAFCLKLRPGISPALMRVLPLPPRADDELASRDAEGMTPLMLACLYEDAEAVAALLQKGADADARSNEGLTALMCVGGSAAKARLLLDRGAGVNARSAIGRTALILAAGYDGGFELVQLLLERGAEVNAADDEGLTPLISAARSGDRARVDLLLEHGAGLEARTEEGLTALSWATTQADAAMVRHLLERGARPEAEAAAAEATPLIWAVSDGMPEVVDALLDHGADMEARDELGFTPLMWAATVHWGDSEILATLLERGANLHARSASGDTALSQALLKGNARHAELLRAAGAGDPIAVWLSEATVALPEEAAMPQALTAARVVGLGEATHGQHEFFELKRRLTMQLVREQGFRIVAYEASSARALACDDYVAGRSGDLAAAMKGFGMRIWQIEENAALLQDLRDWNASAAPADRVRFVGVDVQDAEAAAARLHALLLEHEPALAARIQPLGTRMEAARDALYTGQAAEFDALWGEVETLRAELQESHAARAQALTSAVADEVLQRGRELTRFMSAARTPGGRDRAMAETLLEELERSGSQSKAVLWAHNTHVTLGPLRHEGLAEPAMGGVLRASLGQSYYAAGFLFGEGSFNALAHDPDRGWIFRSTTLSPAPTGSLEATFSAARLGASFLDLRAAPRSGVISDWLDAPHGQRWFGGANIPEDADAQTQDAARLVQTIPRQDYDGLIYLPKTSPSRPR